MSKTRIHIGILLGIAFCIGVPVIWGLSEFFQRQEEAHCNTQLKYVCMSLDNYCRAHGGHLPPLYVEDKDGTPAHSWRALILPYVAYNIYEHYSFAEPWNSPDNRRFAGHVKSYACPSHSTSPDFTSYVAVAGDTTLWPLPKGSVITHYRTCGEHATPWPDIESPVKLPSNGPERIVLVELADSDIPWAAPRDIALETLVDLVKADPTGKRLSQYVKRIVTVDASREFHILDPSEDPERAALIVYPTAPGNP